MTRSSNRKTVLAAASVLLLIGGCCLCPKKTQPPRIRPAVSTISSARLEAYRKGVAAMKALPVTDPRSWLYQASMHGFFDQATEKDPNYVPFAVPFVAHAQANNTWRQCRHNTDAFLVWHRVYLVYFERIMRKVSGQPDLMLPYWDYTIGVDSARRIPPAFRDPTYVPAGQSVPIANPLYAKRRASLNAGTSALDPLTVGFTGAVQKTQFFDSIDGFSNDVEGTPHGAVHIAVGDPASGRVMMGLFETAAQDPIFWLHHANIDRLWDCWNRRGNANPASIAIPGPFPFVDENGNVVTLSAAELLSMAVSPDYTYESYADCEAVPVATRIAAATTPAPAPSSAVISAAAEPVKLSSRPTTLTLRLARDAAKELETTLREPAGRRLVLALQDITAARDPGVIYHVYLVGSAKAGPGKLLAGSFHFFGRVSPSGAGHEAHGAAPFSIAFDVSRTLAQLSSDRAMTDIEIRIEPSSGVTGDTAESLDRLFDRTSQPSIRRIELRVQGANPHE
jgi:hypothetical protein